MGKSTIILTAFIATIVGIVLGIYHQQGTVYQGIGIWFAINVGVIFMVDALWESTKAIYKRLKK